MQNVFTRTKKHSHFSWEQIGDIKRGRENLGEDMPVLVYRLLEYSLNHVLAKEYGQAFSDEVFRKAGELAGKEFAKNVLDLSQNFNGFITQLQTALRDLKIGILRVEEFDTETGSFVLTVGEDLDCSGLPITDEVVCVYDEGFIAGILFEYTGREYRVKEVDCWSSGDRVCRFRGEVNEDGAAI